jgi:3-oxoacyl-[acyl-carrier-protein] synthase III
MSAGRAAVLAGLGTCLPPQVVTNEMLCRELDTSDAWIRSRTGITQRRIAAAGTATGDLAAEAARQALRSAGLPGTGLVVVATSTPDRPCPATAPWVAAELGLAGVAAFDIAAVCTGFVYALAAASAMIVAGLSATALAIGADTFSKIMNPADRGTRVIFGDGAGAAVLRAGRPSEDGALLAFDLGSDGGAADLVTVRAGGSRWPAGPGLEPGADRYFSMAGKATFTHAVLRMSASAEAAAKQAGWPLPDVDWLVPHQANQRILGAVGEQLALPPGRIASNISRVGNTVAASIPLALADAAAAGDLRPGHKVLLTGFGGGLTWGSAALTWPAITPFSN